MAPDQPHHRRFAHDHGARFREIRDYLVDQAVHTDAADFLVICEGEMDRHRQVRGDHLRCQRERNRHEALHVAGAAPVQLAVCLAQLERGLGPVLAVDRHHVGMSGQNHAALVGRPNGGPKIGFRTGLVMHNAAYHP